MKRLVTMLALLPLSAAAGCSEDVGGGEGGSVAGDGTPLEVEVPASGRVYVDLEGPAVIEVDDPDNSFVWDLAIEGYEIFTNGGLSGPGDGGGFGPLDLQTFADGERPAVPFIIEDEAGGAFVRWWAYDGNDHVIYSRFHTYGIRDEADRLFKTQIITFYGEVAGGPVSALYKVRFAEVTPGDNGTVTQIDDLDGTAGGVNPSDDAPSGCLDLASGSVLMLTPAEAKASNAWHLCFRRDSISVNGELGGPRGVGAVDVDAASLTEEETVDEVKNLTAEGELPAFEAIDHATLDDPALEYRGDRILSFFGTRWYDASASPRVPRPVSWMPVGADGEAIFLLVIDALEGATADTPGTIKMRIKQVR